MKCNLLKANRTGIFLIILSLSVFMTASALWAQACQMKVDARVVIMLDRSGSVSPADFESQKAAASALIDRFATLQQPQPAVAVGVFGDPTRDETPEDAAQIVIGLTQNYAAVKAAISPLVAGETFWATNIEQAILKARGEFLSNGGSSNNNYLIIISDGLPDRPGLELYKDCGACGCLNSFDAAKNAAALIEAAPVNASIFAVYFSYNTNSLVDCTPDGEPKRSRDFMANEIASAPKGIFFQEGTFDLTPVFTSIAETVACNDGNACTRDICSGTSCVYEAYPPGNPATSYDRCSVCGGDGESCLGCNVSSSATTGVKDAVGKQYNNFKAAATLAGKYKKDSKTRKYIKSQKSRALLVQKSCSSGLSTYPAEVRHCTNTVFCSSYDIGKYISPCQKCSAELKKLTSNVLKKVPGSPASALRKKKSVQKSADKWNKSAVSGLAKMPKTASNCS